MDRQSGALPISDYTDNQQFTNHTSNTVIHFSGHTFTASGGTILGQHGNNVIIYSSTGGTGSSPTWSSITGKPNWVGSGATTVSLVGNDYRIYTPVGGSTSWNAVTGKPAWLSGTTLGAFEAQHSHSQYVTDISMKLDKSIYQTYTGTTAPNTFLNKNTYSTYTGTTAPAAFASKSFVSTYTGTTAPATYASKSKFDAHTGTTSIHFTQAQIAIAESQVTNLTTDLGNKLNTSTYQTYTGTTAPSIYASKSFVSTYTGTTAPATYATKVNAVTGATNLGTGQAIYTSVSTNKVQLKSLKVLGSLSITNDSTSITISGASGTGGSTNNPVFTGTVSSTGGLVAFNTDSNFGVNLAAGTSTGTINLGGTGIQAINIGAGTGAKTIGIGNLSSNIVMKGGFDFQSTDSISIGAFGGTPTIYIGGSTPNTQEIQIGAGGNNYKLIMIGNDNTVANQIKIGGTLSTTDFSGTINLPEKSTVNGVPIMHPLRKTANQTINGGAAVFVDITDLTFPVVSGVDYAFFFYITFRSAAATTGWKASVNCPAGTLDFWAQSDIIANGAAGVATHTERHNVTRDDMTLLTATVTAGVDLSVRINGRYLCTANGTLAARFANELAADTNIVVQKGSWGWWF